MRILFVFFLFLAVYAFSAPPHQYDKPLLPYISVDQFRSYSDHIYDRFDKSLDPQMVQPGQTVFVQTKFLKNYFEKFHPEIPSKYILITHDSDHPAPGSYSSYLDDPKIIAWFGENFDGCAHPKMHYIPMGIGDSRSDGSAGIIKKMQQAPPAKEHLVHMSFTIQTSSRDRWPVYRLFSQDPFIFKTSKKPFEEYLHDVASSKFEIAPRGFALDTYRLWECLYIGTIPIVKTSSLDNLYEGLPILIVKDWKQVTEQFLNEQYAEMSRKSYNLEKLSFSYWTKIIDSYKGNL